MSITESPNHIDVELPLWLRVILVGFVCSHWYIFLHALALFEESNPFTSSLSIVYYALLGLALLGIFLVFIAWISPSNKYLVLGYLLIRKFRWIVSLLGISMVLLFVVNGKTITSISRLLIYLNAIFLVLIGKFLKPIPPGFRITLHRLPKWIVTFWAALFPIIVSLCTLYLGFNVKISDYRPRIWNDQVGYWHWARSFSYYGFGGGYNGWNELTARATFNPFAENGPFYPMIYGTIGWFFGWIAYLPILINMGLITIPLIVFMRVIKLNRKQIIMSGLLTTMLWPILLYLPTSMHESLNQAIAIIVASIFSYIILNNGVIKPYHKVGFLFFLIFASFIRLSWGILLLPLLFMIIKGNALQRLFISFLLSLLIGIAIIQMNSYLIPPAGNIIYTLIEGSISTGPKVLFDHFSNELQHLIFRERNRIDLVVVLQLMTLSIWNILSLFSLHKENRNSQTNHLQTTLRLNIYNLLAPLGMALFFYLVNGFHRILITHILVSALLLIVNKSYKPIYGIIIISVLAGLPFLNEYKQLKVNFIPDSKEFLESKALIEEYIVFDDNTYNPWCNTVLLPINKYNYHVTMIPPGIGVSPIIYPDTLEFPLKSKYLLFDTETFDSFSAIINTEILVSLEYVTLYQNLDADCP